MDYKIDSNWVHTDDKEGNILAEVTFPNSGDNVVTINHTFVDSSLRGQGVAAELMEIACDVIEKSGKKAIPTCTYAIKWFSEHPEKKYLIAE